MRDKVTISYKADVIIRCVLGLQQKEEVRSGFAPIGDTAFIQP